MVFGRTRKAMMTFAATAFSATFVLISTAVAGTSVLEGNTKKITFETSGNGAPEKTLKCAGGVVTLVSGRGMLYNPGNDIPLNTKFTHAEEQAGTHKVLSVVKFRGETTIYFEQNGKTIEKECRAIETANEG